MNNVVLLLGANLGEIEKNIRFACQLINQNIGKITKYSSLYQSEAWGFESSDFFINQAIEVSTALTPFGLLKTTQAIESQIGRKSKTTNQEYSSRLMDIDILFFNNEVIETETLTVPHPRLHLRNFTLMPLTDIRPNYIHPKLKKSINSLLKDSEDNISCSKIS